MTYGSTTPDAIAYLTSGSPVNPVTESSTQATSIQNALSLRPFYNYVWANATARTAQTGMRPGDLGYQSDIAVGYQYLGPTFGWSPNTAGAGRILAGTTTINPVASGSTFVGSVSISFPSGYFSSTPNIVTTATTIYPQYINTVAGGVSPTGFTLYLSRNNTSSTGASWIAVL